MYDITIIGGGIIGSTIAYRLSKYNLKVLLLEKNSEFASESTKGCSGIISNAFNLDQDSIKINLVSLGYKIWTNEIFRIFIFKKRKTRMMSIALNDNELHELQDLYNRLIAQGVCSPTDIKISGRDEILFNEPKLTNNCIGGLISNSSWVINPIEATNEFLRNAKLNNVELRLNSNVTEINNKKDHFEITLQTFKKINSRYIINCAGAYASDIENLIGLYDFNLLTKKFEYRIFKNDDRPIESIIFHNNNSKFNSFFVPTLDGNIISAVSEKTLLKREDSDVVEINNNEVYQTISELIPKFNTDKLTGILSAPKQTFDVKNDFVIKYATNNSRFINVAGINFSGLTAAPAIALYVEKLLKNSNLRLRPKNIHKLLKV